MTPFPSQPSQVVVVGLWAFAAVTVVALADPERDRAVTMPEGTLLIASLTQSLSTATSAVDDPIVAHTVHPVLLPDGGMIPTGARVSGTVTHVRSGRHHTGAPELGLRFTELEIDDDRYPIATATFHVHGQHALLAAGLAPGGRAVMGGSVRRAPGAGGAVQLPGAAGVAIGSGVVIGSDGRELVLSAGRRLQIRLTAPVQLRYDPATAEAGGTQF